MAAMSCKSNIAMAAYKKYNYASITISRLCIIRHSRTNNHSQVSIGPHNFSSPEILNIHSALQTQRSFYTSATFHAANTIKSLKYSTSSVTNQLANDTQKEVSKNQDNSKNENDIVSNSLHKLNLNIQRTGRAYIRNVEGIFDAVKARNTCTSNEALLLLRCCGNFLTDEKPSVRAELSEKIWKFLQNSGIQLDTSHYNALLKNRLDNEMPDFKPAEFIATMEKNGVETNRVTFQHLIAKFCSSGDIQGATTILEYMKEQRLPVNENVFHSLIVGHSRAGNFEEAKNVMKIMVESGVDVDIDTRMIYVLELARGDQEFLNEINRIKDSGLRLSDHELFKLIVLLLNKGDKELANEVASILPKKRGFFQEMRNFIPAMISAGELELPFKILSSFALPPTLGSEGHSESSREDHGLFFLNAMIKNEYDPKLLISYANKLQAPAPSICSRILEFCVDHGNIRYGQSVYDEIVTSFGKDVIVSRNFSNFVRSRANDLQAHGIGASSISSATAEFLVNMGAIGIRPLTSDISQSLMPNMMAGSIPGRVMKSIHTKIDELRDEGIELRNPAPYYSISNSMLQYLLNVESTMSFAQVIGYITTMKVPTKPHLWNTGLARSFLATESLDCLVSMLFLCSSDVKNHLNDKKDKKELRLKNDEDLFITLNQIVALAPRYRPGIDPTELLTPILNELRVLKVGVPETVTCLIKRNVEGGNKEFELLLDQLQEIYNGQNTYWTEERARDLARERKQIAFNVIGNVRPDFVEIGDYGDIPADQIPTDLQGLARVQRLLEKKDRWNSTVLNKVITLHIEDGNLHDANVLLDKYFERKYAINALTIHTYIQECLRSSQVQKAEDFLQNATSKKIPHRISDYVDIAKVKIDQGNHEGVLEMFKNIDVKCLQPYPPKFTHAFEIVRYYVDNYDDQKAKEVFQILQNGELITDKRTFEKVKRGNIEKVEPILEDEIEEFETAAREKRKLIRPIKLLKKLSLKEDTNGIQRVLDASINVIGEEQSMYNLAFCFIETGKLTQAKKILATPGLRYNDKSLNYAMEGYKQNGLVNEMEYLVSFCQPIFACDREHMYSRLISICVQTHQYNKIQEAWVNIQEEGFGPSDSLKMQIAKGLQAGNLTVPFAVPEEEFTQELPDGNKSPRAYFKNKGSGNEVSQILQAAIDEKDTDKVMNYAKELLAQRNLLHEEGEMIVNYIKDLEDVNLRFDLLQTIFDNDQLRQLTYRFSYAISNAMDNFDKSQLEYIFEKLPGRQLLKYGWLRSKIAHLHATEDIEGFLSTLRSEAVTPDSRFYSPGNSVLQDVIQQGHAEKLRDICLESYKISPKLSIETMKSCLILGKHSDIVDQIWEKVKNIDLDRNTFWNRTLFQCSNEEIQRVIDFYTSCLNSLSLKNKTKAGLQESVIDLYDRMLITSLNDNSTGDQNNIEKPENILNRALGSWITLDR